MTRQIMQTLYDFLYMEWHVHLVNLREIQRDDIHFHKPAGSNEQRGSVCFPEGNAWKTLSAQLRQMAKVLYGCGLRIRE